MGASESKKENKFKDDASKISDSSQENSSSNKSKQPNENKISIEKELENLKHKIYYLLSIYEFYQMPQVGPNTISMENFAKVLVSYVNIYKAKNILNKIQEKQFSLEGEVTFDEFFCFFLFMNCLLNDKYSIFQNNKLSFEDLKKLINQKKGSIPDFGIKIKKHISDAQLKVLINIFDDNGKFVFINHNL